MTGDVVVLDGDRHESALTEKRGQFQEVCGCGWRSTWTTAEAARREHESHVAAEKLWGRLTEPQREVIDALMTQRGPRGMGGFGQGSLETAQLTRSRPWRVSGRAAASLARLGYVVRREDPYDKFGFVAALTDRGREVHPLSRCSARHGGKPCGYCHQCARRLPAVESMACPGCGATDYDE